MRRTNRVEPVNIDVRSLAHAVMITTTELEIIRRVEVRPITESIVDHIRCPSTASVRSSRTISWCIGCLFLTAGILAISIVITGFSIVFGRMKAMKKSNIERYDLGDLHYGINNVNYPSNIYLSNINKVFIHNYLSDQLLAEPGYRGLMMDEIFLRNNLHNNKQRQRCCLLDCLDHSKYSSLFRSLSDLHKPTKFSPSSIIFNRTAFREPFYLLFNSQYSLAQICSTPNISHLITPTQLDLFDIEKINTHRQSSSPQVDYVIPKDITTDIPTIDSTESTSVEASAIFSTVHSSTITSPDSTQTPQTSSLSSLDSQTFSYTTDSSISSLDPQTSSSTTDSSIFSLDPQTSSYTTESSPSSRKTTASMFQFLPFRPPSTISSWYSVRPHSPLINRQRMNSRG